MAVLWPCFGGDCPVGLTNQPDFIFVSRTVPLYANPACSRRTGVKAISAVHHLFGRCLTVLFHCYATPKVCARMQRKTVLADIAVPTFTNVKMGQPVGAKLKESTNEAKPESQPDASSATEVKKISKTSVSTDALARADLIARISSENYFAISP